MPEESPRWGVTPRYHTNVPWATYLGAESDFEETESDLPWPDLEPQKV